MNYSEEEIIEKGLRKGKSYKEIEQATGINTTKIKKIKATLVQKGKISD